MYKRLAVLAVCALAAALAPAAAQAKAHSGVVLSRHHKRIEIIDARHAVHSYKLGVKHAHVHAGTRVKYRTHGKRVVALRVRARAHRYSFLGKVASSGRKGVVVRLADGRRLRLATAAKRLGAVKGKAHAAGSITLNIQGLKPGQTVLVTVDTDADGNVAITLQIQQGDDVTGGEDQDVTGTVTAIGDGSLTIESDAGDSMTFAADPELLDGVEVGDSVDVTYYDDGTGALVADDVEEADTGGDDLDAVGVVTAIDADGLTVDVPGQGSMTFHADPDLTDGVQVGDSVDVTYYVENDGTLTADDVEWADDGSGDGAGDPSDGEDPGDSGD